MITYDYSMYLNFPWDIHPSWVTAYVCKWSPARWHVRRLRGCRRRRRRSSNNLNIQKETNMQRKQTYHIIWWWKQEQMMITKVFRKTKPIKTPYHWTIWRLYSYTRTVVFALLSEVPINSSYEILPSLFTSNSFMTCRASLWLSKTLNKSSLRM